MWSVSPLTETKGAAQDKTKVVILLPQCTLLPNRTEQYADNRQDVTELYILTAHNKKDKMTGLIAIPATHTLTLLVVIITGFHFLPISISLYC